MCREFPAPKIWHVKALPFFQSPHDNVFELPGIVRLIRRIRHFKMRLNHIFHIAQKKRSPLHNLRFAADVKRLFRPIIGLQHTARQNFALHFVSPHAGELNGFLHIDPVNHPSQARMPIDRFQDPSGR